MATEPMKYLNNYGTYMTAQTGKMTNINSFGQDPVQGMAGTYDKSAETIAPDDKLEVGYKRFLRDMNPSNKILWEKPKRQWRKRREELKKLKKEK